MKKRFALPVLSAVLLLGACGTGGKNDLGERVEIVYAPDGSHVDRIYETGGAHRNLGCGRQSDRCLRLNFTATKTASLRDLSHGAGPFFDSRVSRRCGIR